MEIALIEIKKAGDNKDYNAGFGTTFNLKTTPLTFVLKKTRKHLEKFPTISYAYISAIFKKFNHVVNYYQNALPIDCSLALLNVTAIRHKQEIQIINEIKRKKKYKIGVYGALATVMPELFKNVDFIITGEPENAVFSIAKTGKIPQGIVKSLYVEELDSLPFPDWDIFDVKKFSYSPLLTYKPFLFMQSSRGCKFSCSYCPHRLNGKYRKRSIQNVLDEMLYLKEKYRVKGIHFRDSYFNFNENEAQEFLSEMIKRRLDIKWGMETRIDSLNTKLVDILYDAGLRAVKTGIESSDMKLLEKFNRMSPDLEHAKNVIRYCNGKKIKSNACYILGFPSQDKTLLKKTLDLSFEIKSTFANFFILTPLPGTNFDTIFDLEITDENLNHRDNFHLVFKHENFTNKELRKIQANFISRYYFRYSWIKNYVKIK